MKVQRNQSAAAQIGDESEGGGVEQNMKGWKYQALVVIIGVVIGIQVPILVSAFSNGSLRYNEGLVFNIVSLAIVCFVALEELLNRVAFGKETNIVNKTVFFIAGYSGGHVIYSFVSEYLYALAKANSW